MMRLFHKNKNAFTLIELLVAMTIFMMLMTVATSFFQSMSSGTTKTLEILELHRKADAITRYLAYDMRNLQQTMALQLQLKDETKDPVIPLSMTFMVATTEQGRDPEVFGPTADGRLNFEGKLPRRADFVWIHWKFEDGIFYRGESRRAHNLSNGVEEQSWNWKSNVLIDNTVKAYLAELDLKADIPRGVQNNHISPTPQREFIYFEGLGNPVGVSPDGSVSVGAKGRVRVSQTVADADFTENSCNLLDGLIAPWRVDGIYSHLYTTIAVGNQTALGKDAYAVVNTDGLSVNKDKINLFGTDDVDANGENIYPSQVKNLFYGAEYVVIDLVRSDGAILAAGNIKGIHHVSGIGADKRPVAVRLSYLLHGIDPHIQDDSDFDNDDNVDESLADAIRSVVAAESLTTRLENIHEFQKYCRKFGYASLFMHQSIPVGL